METNSIQKAVQDLSLIRQTLENVKSGEAKLSTDQETKTANAIVFGCMALFAGVLSCYEIFSDFSMTHFAMLSAHDGEVGIWGLAQVFIALPVMLMGTYFVVWRASKHVDEDFSSYVSRNFRYLKNLSIFSDLLTKFAPLSILVIAGQPQYIAPLLVLYIGDYLVNGRFFNFPVKISMGLGIACIVAAASQYALHSSQLIVPLAIFTALSIASLVRVVFK